MTQLNLSLPDELMSFIEAEAAREGLADAGAYVRVLILEAQRRRARRALDDKLKAALESGPARPMGAEDWAALREEALEGLRGESIRP